MVADDVEKQVWTLFSKTVSTKEINKLKAGTPRKCQPHISPPAHKIIHLFAQRHNKWSTAHVAELHDSGHKPPVRRCVDCGKMMNETINRRGGRWPENRQCEERGQHAIGAQVIEVWIVFCESCFSCRNQRNHSDIEHFSSSPACQTFFFDRGAHRSVMEKIYDLRRQEKAGG